MSHQPYTVGFWTVRPGNEKAFIAEWEKFAKWTAQNQPGAATGRLLQDAAQPGEFISLGAWESVEAINAWRESPEFKAFAMQARELCSEFKPRSLALVASSE